MRVRSVTLAALVLIAGIFITLNTVGTPRAAAEVYDCGTAGHYFAGYYQHYASNQYEGAYATIVTNYGAVCDTVTGHKNFTAEWTMIAGDYSGSYPGYAQSGYLRWYNSYIYFFAQQNDGVGDINTYYGTSPLSTGSSYTYKQHYYTSCGCIKSIEDTTVLLTSSWNPFTYWNEFSVQYSGEAAYLESDIAGNAASPTVFSSLQGELQSTDLFANIPCNYLTHVNDGNKTRADGEAWWDYLVGSCPQFQNYTDTAG